MIKFLFEYYIAVCSDKKVITFESVKNEVIIYMYIDQYNCVRRSRALSLFPACITSAINSKYYSKPYCYKLIQYVCVVLSTQ